MAERKDVSNPQGCGPWEALLADAVDGLLMPADEAAFAAHRAVCPSCTALYEDARRGREWLVFLSPEPEVPAGLLDKILARTGPGIGPGQVEGYGLIPAGSGVVPMQPGQAQVWQRPGILHLVVAQARRFAEPRLMMTAAMAFFTIALTLNLTGIRLTDIRLADLRPAAVRSVMERRVNMASTPIIRYYDHSRLVSDVVSTVRELRQTTESQNKENQQRQEDNLPGESRQNPDYKNRKPGNDAPQHAVDSNSNEFLESSLTNEVRSAHSGGSGTAVRDGSKVWTA
jgi:hypothetical protein